MERRGRVPVEGAEARIRSWGRPKRLTWMHNKLNKQTSITEFMFPLQPTNMADSVEVVGRVGQTVASGSGSGLETGLGSGLGPGRVQPAAGPTRKVQDRIDHRKQRKMDTYLKKAVDSQTEMDSSMGANSGRVMPGQLSWVPGATESRRKQIDSGPLDDVESLEQHIEEDQVRIQEEITLTVTQSQANDTRILTGEDQIRIERKKQIALTIREEKRKSVETNGVDIRVKRKKEYHDAAEKALEKSEHKKRKREEYNTTQVVRPGDRKRKRKRVECSQSLKIGGHEKKREREESHITLPTTEGKRRNTDGQDGCNQLGSGTHKGIS